MNKCNVDSTYFEDFALIVFLEIVGKDVCEHQGSSALAQNIDGLLQELNLDPGHIVLLHFFHLVLRG